MKTVHIDTSLQIERCKEQSKRKVVEDALKPFRFTSTSSYAKLEFKCSWLRDLAYLYRASQRVTRFDELLGYIDDKLNKHPANRRRIARCLQAIVAYLSQVPPDFPHGVVLLRLRRHIFNAVLGAYDWWDSSVTHEYNGTSCVRAAERPKKLSGRSLDVSVPKCAPGRVNCRVHEFFRRHKDKFTAIASAIENLGDGTTKEQKEAAQMIRRTVANPLSLCDDRNCRKLGDVLIAVDGLEMDCFAANNDKEWQLLSDVLGKLLLNPLRRTNDNTA